MSNNKFKLSLAEHESVFADLNDDTFDGRSPVERPKAVILGGQPGAGKSKLSEIMQQNGMLILAKSLSQDFQQEVMLPDFLEPDGIQKDLIIFWKMYFTAVMSMLSLMACC